MTPADAAAAAVPTAAALLVINASWGYLSEVRARTADPRLASWAIFTAALGVGAAGSAVARQWPSACLTAAGAVTCAAILAAGWRHGDREFGRLDSACAADTCDGAGSCVAHNLAAGTACGASSGCGQPTCSASGTCERHDAANGSACTGGSCAVGACVQGQRVGCPQSVVTAVPFQGNWSSVGLPNLFTGSCQSARTPDYAVELVVPATGRYRFEATGSPDSMLTLSRGACAAGNGTEIGCNDDITDGTNRASRLDAMLTAGDTITVYVSEFGDEGTGAGTLKISAL